ncbi:Hypothetical predicted protein [Olea europaea subsp. europaea]|uniref:Uncharacterized protein n=1 Tax=Olea europaea subsp. europaea TaxID=158383 RepID=A0A8S0RCY8_OLEEU|nr:Hypothetical predicted protein [Olea europaea subsp. europaea]
MPTRQNISRTQRQVREHSPVSTPTIECRPRGDLVKMNEPNILFVFLFASGLVGIATYLSGLFLIVLVLRASWCELAWRGYAKKTAGLPMLKDRHLIGNHQRTLPWASQSSLAALEAHRELGETFGWMHSRPASQFLDRLPGSKESGSDDADDHRPALDGPAGSPPSEICTHLGVCFSAATFQCPRSCVYSSRLLRCKLAETSMIGSSLSEEVHQVSDQLTTFLSLF